MTHAITQLRKKIEVHDWKKIYVAFDLHGTIVKPNYKPGELCTEFYPGAITSLRFLSASPDQFKLILFTSTPPELIQGYLESFKYYDIFFEYVNSNPEIATEPGHYGDYSEKFYFDLLFDDKAGFDPDTWPAMYKYFTQLKEILS